MDISKGASLFSQVKRYQQLNQTIGTDFYYYFSLEENVPYNQNDVFCFWFWSNLLGNKGHNPHSLHWDNKEGMGGGGGVRHVCTNPTRTLPHRYYLDGARPPLPCRLFLDYLTTPLHSVQVIHVPRTESRKNHQINKGQSTG